MAEGKKRIVWWQVLLLSGTLAAAAVKIFTGMDCDESYIVTMGARLLQGDRLFDTMWELHMTSAWPAFLGMFVYQKLTGSLAGVVLFLRLLSTLIQFAAVYVSCRILKKYFSFVTVFVFGIAAASFLPRAVQNLEYGLLVLLFLLPAVVLLYDVLKKLEESGRIVWWELIVSGICYALGVLSYPTVVFSFPALLAALFMLPGRGNKKAGLKLSGAYLLVCAVCAVLFFLYVFSYLPPGQLLRNLSGILLDGTHSDVGRLGSYLSQSVVLLKRALPVLAAAAVIACILRKWKALQSTFPYLVLACGTAVVIGFNVTGLRPSGPIGFQVRYMLAAAAGFLFYRFVRDRLALGLFLLPGVFVYLGVLAGSNMGLEENASFLFLTVLGTLLLSGAALERMEGIAAGICLLCIGVFAAGILFTKGYLVRITGTGPANILESRVQVQEGPLQGIFLYEEDALAYEQKRREIREYVTSEDLMLYLGTDALCNLYTEGRFTSASCISTPSYNEQWIRYYETFDCIRPTVVLLDKDFFTSPAEFMETPFGAWLMKQYPSAEFSGQKAFYILQLHNPAELLK